MICHVAVLFETELCCWLAMLQCVRPMVGLAALVRKAHVYEILLKLMTSVDTYVQFACCHARTFSVFFLEYILTLPSVL